ncbi:MAG: tRNA pseudouridine(38-40) synthase TruA [Candidatus Latescibacteria bacterium]|nr:tRNA pseudouridine(38-40) synthase TruA [Candidatus Latescibacterota bacterium]
MYTVKLVLEYDGTRFAGWQVQPCERTVQKVVEDTIEKVVHHPVRLIAAGRTDAGVHAAGQVAGFKTESDMEMWRLEKALNGLLPRDVSVIRIDRVHDSFNARFDAKSRSYRYTISDRRLSIGRKYAWHVTYKLDRTLLESSTSVLNGECDLRGFSKGNENQDFSTIVMKNQWTFNNNLMIFDITAIRFFHHAVRGIIGSAVEIARGKSSPSLMKQILETRDRKLAGPTAPAHGLCLVHVDYGE